MARARRHGSMMNLCLAAASSSSHEDGIYKYFDDMACQ